jgi:TIR domain
MARYKWDVFISHASEDKDSVARPLANHLKELGLKVWLDEHEIHIGDSLRGKLDAGLAKSRFGIVILSPNFFSKRWPKSELDGLVARENEGTKVVLPIWHNLDYDDVAKRSPILAGRVAADTGEGLAEIASKIVRAIENSGSTGRRSIPLLVGRLTKKTSADLPARDHSVALRVKGRRRAPLPPALSKAVKEASQCDLIYQRVRYQIEFRMLKREPIMRFTVTMDVLNRSRRQSEYRGIFDPAGRDKKILHATINGSTIDVRDPDRNFTRGLQIIHEAEPNEKFEIVVSGESTYHERDSEIVGAYRPCNHLEIIIKKPPVSLTVNLQRLLPKTVETKTLPNGDLSFDYPDGVLPFQGTRIYWQPA